MRKFEYNNILAISSVLQNLCFQGQEELVQVITLAFQWSFFRFIFL